MPVEKPPDGWISTKDVVERCRIAIRTVENYRAKGKIIGKLCDGAWYYDPSSLPDPGGGEDVDAIAALTKALKEAHDYIRFCNDKFLQWGELFSADHVKMGDRCTALQSAVDAGRAVADQMMTDQLARDIARIEHEAKMRRLDSAFRKLEEHGPAILSALVDHFSPQTGAKIRENKLSEKLAKIPEGAIRGMGGTGGFLDESEVAELLTIRAATIAQNAAAAKAKIAAASNSKPETAST